MKPKVEQLKFGKKMMVYLISKGLYLLKYRVRSWGSWVRRGRGLSRYSGMKFYNLQITYINNWLAIIFHVLIFLP